MTDEKKTWREKAGELHAIFSTLPRAVLLVFREAPGHTTLLLVTTVLRGILPVLMLWTTKRIIDTIVTLSASSSGADTALRSLLPFLLLYLLFLLLREVGSTLVELSEQTMGDRMLSRMNTVLMEKRLPR